MRCTCMELMDNLEMVREIVYDKSCGPFSNTIFLSRRCAPLNDDVLGLLSHFFLTLKKAQSCPRTSHTTTFCLAEAGIHPRRPVTVPTFIKLTLSDRDFYLAASVVTLPRWSSTQHTLGNSAMILLLVRTIRHFQFPYFGTHAVVVRFSHGSLAGVALAKDS